jgi:hypothetical protein
MLNQTVNAIQGSTTLPNQKSPIEIANRQSKSPIEIANRNRQSSLRLFHNKQNKQKQFLFVSYICFRKTAT